MTRIRLYSASSATAAALVLVLGAPTLGGQLANTTECEILVTAPLESEVIDATDGGSFLLFKWEEKGGIQEVVSFWKNGPEERIIPTIDGYTHTQAMALSSNDVVLCTSLRRGAFIAFVWKPRTGQRTPLPLLDGFRSSYGYSISHDGKSVCGFQVKEKHGNVPVVWTSDADGNWTCQQLPVSYEDNPLLTTAGVRISPSGKIIVAPITVDMVPGAVNPYVSQTHMWTKDKSGEWTRRLRSRSGLAVHAVNDHGTFVGRVTQAVGGVMYPRAYVCTMEKGVQVIGVLDGDVASEARDINNHGIVVGWTTDPYGPTDPEKDLGYDDPFVWTAKDGMRKIVIASAPSKGGHGSVTKITDGNRIGGRVTIVDELNEPAFTALLKSP